MRNYVGGTFLGIVNARSKCIDSDIEDLHSNMMDGTWDPNLDCRPGRRIVGVNVIGAANFHKLVNFRAQCANIPT